jgi:hypothetical protein
LERGVLGPQARLCPALLGARDVISGSSTPNVYNHPHPHLIE